MSVLLFSVVQSNVGEVELDVSRTQLKLESSDYSLTVRTGASMRQNCAVSGLSFSVGWNWHAKVREEWAMTDSFVSVVFHVPRIAADFPSGHQRGNERRQVPQESSHAQDHGHIALIGWLKRLPQALVAHDRALQLATVQLQTYNRCHLSQNTWPRHRKRMRSHFGRKRAGVESSTTIALLP